MCTNFSLIRSSGTDRLSNRLSIDPDSLVYARHNKPGSEISIVVEQNGDHIALDATWWLYLKQTEAGLKPDSRYFSVNTNYAKLPKKYEYKRSRCIVMASSFVESQNGNAPHEIRPEDESAMAFGGLWKTWRDQVTGDTVHSASIITLPGLPELAHIHRKAFPLWLPEDSYDIWLDPDVTNTDTFSDLLNPKIRKPLLAWPVDRALSKQPIGPAQRIS